MKTVEILSHIVEIIRNNPDFINEIQYEDIYELVYLDIQCRRQLYPPDQMSKSEAFFDTILSSVRSSLEKHNTLLFDKSITELIMYLCILPDSEYVSDFVERANMDHLRLEHLLNNTIYVIGDSHVNFFSGNEELSFAPVGEDINTSRQIAGLPFSIFHMGPCLAYNSNRYNSTCRFREKLDYLLENVVESGAHIMFVLGWIDLRVHVFKQSIMRNCRYEIIVDDIIDNYVDMMRSVKNKGYNILCFGPIGTLSEKVKMQDKYEESGTEVQRNRATAYFTEKLANKCEQEEIPFISLFDKLVTEDWHTRFDFLCNDGCHLGQSAIPLLMDELKRKKIIIPDR